MQFIKIFHRFKILQILGHSAKYYNEFRSNKIDAAKKRYIYLLSDWATFNIRKVQRKGQIRQPEELGLYTPEYDFDKYPEVPTYTSTTIPTKI